MIEFPNLNFIDWIVLSLLLTTSLIGLNNGFIREFLNFFIWTMSILFSLLVISKLLFSNLIDQNIISSLIIFFILVLISFIIFKLIMYYLIGNLKNMINNNYLDNFFGLIFGFIKGLFLILLSTSGMIYLFYTTKDFPTFLKNSLFFEPIKIYSIKIIEKIVNFI
tara:strand:- start:429 stop:923 length:495 start_codon:yes stop_codon:yes gene_type:complete